MAAVGASEMYKIMHSNPDVQDTEPLETTPKKSWLNLFFPVTVTVNSLVPLFWTLSLHVVIHFYFFIFITVDL